RAVLEERGREVLGLVREIVARDGSARHALDTLIEGYIGWLVPHPDFLRMHLRAGTSSALSPAGTGAQGKHGEEIHARQADVLRRGVAEGVFVEEAPAYLARMFSAMDQVLLAEWVAGGMRGSREALIARLRAQVERSFCRSMR